ncbi:MAG: TlpA disulfide reductase family protein [Oscillospiraceae bacterium]|nr:TlpA disulfide reductase family protein [Oscillospiraceae bacterium]
MNKTVKTLLTVLGLALLIGAAVYFYNTLSADYEPEAPLASEGGQESESEKAADFTVYNAGGEAFTLSSFEGRPVVINFWATWCGYCVAEMPDFDEVYSEYGDRVEFMMVNATDEASGETVEAASAYIEENGYGFPVYYDLDGEAVSAYSVRGLPTTYIINSEGGIHAYSVGAISGDALRYALEGLA